jgi:hypothetical protein
MREGAGYSFDPAETPRYPWMCSERYEAALGKVPPRGVRN